MPTTIFWPTDVRDSGFCYGWKLPVLCVAGVLEASTRTAAEEALRSLCNSSRWQGSRSCGGDPEILGACEISQYLGRRGLSAPAIDWSKDHTLIYYTRHSWTSLRFYSLEAIRLDTAEHSDSSKTSMYGQLIQHDFTKPQKHLLPHSLDDTVIHQLNAAKMLEMMLQRTQATSTAWNLSLPSTDTLHLPRLLKRFFAVVARGLTTVCNSPVLLSSPMLLKDLSAAVQQVDVRVEQADFLHGGVGSLYLRESTPISVYSARYTNFFNTIWLILNDITIGFAFGAFLCENHLVLSQILNHTVDNVLVDWVQWVLRWLDSWPAGLKLNTELSRFYSLTFIGLISIWGDILQRGAPYMPTIIYVVGTLSCGGMTVAISLLMDMLALLTLHLYLCYVLARAVYQRMLRTAWSLFNLFRGKRYNVLRKRTDSWEYDIDQLLFGTILFTLLAFLFPTVLVYYALFAMMRLGTILLQACMETLLAFMNHFPLFALMLRLKDPWRLPGGVYFVVLSPSQSTRPSLMIKNQTVPLSAVFFQYRRLWSLLASHYNPLRLLLCVFSGQDLAAIPRYSIRYNKIPSREHLKTAPP